MDEENMHREKSSSRSGIEKNVLIPKRNEAKPYNIFVRCDIYNTPTGKCHGYWKW